MRLTPKLSLQPQASTSASPCERLGGDGINTGGFRFNAPDSDFETNYVGRIDYDLASKIRIFGRPLFS
ncbi:hypothetical protein [Tunturibacter empetritectus]|uniref:Uncharacterized protein n=1 Tax=Tunturiibacter empetritectus TaxID=3069691 RepID=A0A7W8MSK4_9BACT|nr:hypothetical protein [Edaphobacter lichenicola]MBB5317950.1 hypothetical protein [Edaphobacter lichenicola]